VAIQFLSLRHCLVADREERAARVPLLATVGDDSIILLRAILLEDEHARSIAKETLLMTERRIIKVVEVVVDVGIGDITTALRQSWEMAISEWRVVRLIFNDKSYICDPNELEKVTRKEDDRY
jgi:hypothetical protein